MMIALLAAVVVMLAATLLIGLTRRMVAAHVNRLDAAQIVLSESSASDGLAFLLADQGLGAASEPLRFELAEVTTDFTLKQSGAASIRTGFFSVDNIQRAVVIPIGSRLVSAEVADRSTVLITFYSGDTFQST
ncbi:MAG: hypothetical protein GY852_05595, partial [bacterium]|nr:hypothetical protein [bacterium]